VLTWQERNNTRLKELRNLYCSPNINGLFKSRKIRLRDHVVSMGEKMNAFRVLVGNPRGKRPLRRPRSRWEDTIKMDIREIASGIWDGFIWLGI
jgi:hypothetical protein